MKYRARIAIQGPWARPTTPNSRQGVRNGEGRSVANRFLRRWVYVIKQAFEVDIDPWTEVR